MGGHFCLPRLSQQGVAWLSVGESAGSFSRFPGGPLQPLFERCGVLSSITLDRHEGLLADRVTCQNAAGGERPSLTQVIQTLRKKPNE
jgi:hypothetical protein